MTNTRNYSNETCERCNRRLHLFAGCQSAECEEYYSGLIEIEGEQVHLNDLDTSDYGLCDECSLYYYTQKHGGVIGTATLMHTECICKDCHEDSKFGRD